MPDQTAPDPTTAAVLSLFVPGLGHVYLGEWTRGILLHVALWVSLVCAILFFWLIIPLFFPLAVIVFAYRDAKTTALERGADAAE
jgi:TM2 domain-containing membrane protein YozV